MPEIVIICSILLKITQTNKHSLAGRLENLVTPEDQFQLRWFDKHDGSSKKWLH